MKGGKIGLVKNDPIRKRSRLFRGVLLVCLAFIVSSLCSISSASWQVYERQITQLPSGVECFDRHDTPDGGDCQALLGDLRRPDWACFSKMRALLPRFLELYDQRPVRTNDGGMRLDHSFALYYTLLHIMPSPQVVIESGAFRGHSTWMIRQALPNAKIFSLDPGIVPDQRLDGVVYMLQENWTDVANVDWIAKGVDPDSTVLFIDDHQSGYKRALLQLQPMGFSRFIFDDNFAYPHGDNMSMKWVCEMARQAEWPGHVLDNFGSQHIEMTWEYHLKQAHFLADNLRFYYEFPPVVASELSGQTFYNPTYASSPIVTERKVFESMGLIDVDPDEFGGYHHLVYVEIKKDLSEAVPALL